MFIKSADFLCNGVILCECKDMVLVLVFVRKSKDMRIEKSRERGNVGTGEGSGRRSKLTQRGSPVGRARVLLGSTGIFSTKSSYRATLTNIPKDNNCLPIARSKILYLNNQYLFTT